MKYLYKYPQAEFPYTKLVAENRQRGKNQPEYRTAGHRRVRRRPLFRCVRGICQSRRGRHPDQDHGLEPRAGTGQAPSVADDLVSQHLVVGRRQRRASDCNRHGMSPDPAIVLDHPETGKRWLHCEGSPELLFTENETNAQPSVWSRQPYSLRQGRHQRLHRAWRPGSGESRAFRHQGLRALRTYRGRGRKRRSALAPDQRRSARPKTRSKASTGPSRCARARPTNFTRRSFPRTLRRTRRT